MSRQTKIANWMEQAEVVAKRSHDSETKVGSILVKNSSHAVIASGFNGFVRGAIDEELPSSRPDKYNVVLHSEQNLISNCSRHGIATEDCTVVCTLTPCIACARLLFQCGITRVIAKEAYKDFKDMLSIKDIDITHSYTPEGFILVEYAPKIKG